MTRNYGPQTRTQADKLAEAIGFIWNAQDRAIVNLTGYQIAAMKGVKHAASVVAIDEALAKRKERINGI